MNLLGISLFVIFTTIFKEPSLKVHSGIEK
jgi:hypothetical protein